MNELEQKDKDHEVLAAGMFGGDPERLGKALELVNKASSGMI